MVLLEDEKRLRTLRETGLLDTAAEEAFDRFTRLGSRLLGAPVALISLVDGSRQFFKSSLGLAEPWASRRETPLSHSFCAHVVQSGAPLVVADARLEPLLSENLAIAELGVVAYVGVPLVVRDQTLGALCAIDNEVRAWSDEDVTMLRDLAGSVVAEIELRLALREAARQRAFTDVLLEGLGDGVLAIDADRQFVVANSVARRWFDGARVGSPLPPDWTTRFRSRRQDGSVMHPEEGALARALGGEATDALTFTLETGTGPRWLEATGRPVLDPEGRLIAAIAVYRDVTDRMRLVEQNDQSLATILDSIADGLVVTDAVGRLQRINPVAETMTGWPAEEALGRPLDEVLRLEGGATLRSRDGTACNVAVTSSEIVARDATRTGGAVYILHDVSAEHTAHSKLVASEQRYRDLYDSAPDMYMTAELASGTIIDCNRTLCAELGFEKGELLGRPLVDVYHAGDLEAAKRSLAEFPRQRHLADIERRLRRKDGTWLYVSLNLRALRDDAGAIVAAFGVYRDISRRKQTEADRELLLGLSARFEGTTDSAELLRRASVALGEYLEVDRCYFVAVDRNVLTFMPGHAPSLDPLPPMKTIDDRVAATASGLLVIDDVAHDPRTTELDFPFRDMGIGAFVAMPDIQEGRWCGSLVAAMRTPRTWDQREAALVRLVAERTWLWQQQLELHARLREQEVQEVIEATEERFKVLVENVKDYAIFMIDATGLVATWNAGAERLKRYSESEILGMPYETFFTAADIERGHPAKILTLAREEGRYEEEGWRVRKDGIRFWANVVLAPIFARDGRLEGFAKVTRDVTDRRVHDEELASKQLELQQSLREREVLLQEVHHRVKNNLQVISSLINMQARKLDAGGTKSALLECQARVQTIALIHERLYQSPDFARISFAEYVKGLAANVFNASESSAARVELKLDIEDVSIGIDRAVPCGLLLNELLTNALKHAFGPAERGEIRVSLRRSDDRTVCLRVDDTGHGLPSGVDLRTSKSMGLRLVTTLAAQLGGTLTTTNNPGASFSVAFPDE